MENPVEHLRLTMVALRIAGEVMFFISTPVTILTLIARWLERRSGGGKPVFLVAALLISFILSTVSVCLRAVKFNQLYLAEGEKAEPSEKPVVSVDADRKIL
jgi:hypothetical protein